MVWLRPSDVSGKIEKIIRLLREATRSMEQPMVTTIIDEYGKNPFLILISCLLSLRTKDVTTLPVCRILFDKVQTPQQLLEFSVQELEKTLYPVGFYRQKARTLREVSQDLLDRFDGKVPQTEFELLSIKGVGRKTANLVLGEAFDVPAICVDTHVHRISNRLGLVTTKTPEETEQELKRLLPKQYWVEWNRLLVMWGQNICVPISPKCSQCAIFEWCDRVGVKKSR